MRINITAKFTLGDIPMITVYPRMIKRQRQLPWSRDVYEYIEEKMKDTSSENQVRYLYLKSLLKDRYHRRNNMRNG